MFLYIHLSAIFLSDFQIQCGFPADYNSSSQVIYLLSINWSSLVPQASQKAVLLCFPLLCLLFLLLTLTGYWLPQLNNCVFLIHCTFCLFYHQTCSPWFLDLPAHLRLTSATEAQGRSVSLMLRWGQPKSICSKHTAEMAFFQYEERTDTNVEVSTNLIPIALEPHAGRCYKCASINPHVRVALLPWVPWAWSLVL